MFGCDFVRVSVNRLFAIDGDIPSHLEKWIMSTISSFEELRCWKASRELVKMVISASSEGRLSRDFEIRSQLIRAALSSMNNLAEGFGRSGLRDTIRFYEIAQSSACEVKSITYALEDSGYLPVEKIKVIRDKSEETKALTLGLIKYLRTLDKESTKHPSV